MRPFANILARYGKTVELQKKAGEPGVMARAFLQVMTEATDREGIPTPLGLWEDTTFLYLGDPQGSIRHLEEGGVLCDGILYEVLRARLVWMGNRPSHWRGILKVKEETACSN